MTLRPGAVILTGTPQGVGFARNAAGLDEGGGHGGRGDRKDRAARESGGARKGP